MNDGKEPQGELIWMGLRCSGCGSDFVAEFDVEAVKGQRKSKEQHPAIFDSITEAGIFLSELMLIALAARGVQTKLGSDLDASPLVQTCHKCHRTYVYGETDFFIAAEELPEYC